MSSHEIEPTYENGLETNLYSIAEEICSTQPRPPCSIQLVMAHDSHTDVEFEILSEFTLACMRILYGSDTTPYDLTDKDFAKLQEYVNSIGYHIIFTISDQPDYYQYNISFEPYHTKCTKSLEHLRKYMN
jgi:hypothetical protein